METEAETETQTDRQTDREGGREEWGEEEERREERRSWGSELDCSQDMSWLTGLSSQDMRERARERTKERESLTGLSSQDMKESERERSTDSLEESRHVLTPRFFISSDEEEVAVARCMWRWRGDACGCMSWLLDKHLLVTAPHVEVKRTRCRGEASMHVEECQVTDMHVLAMSSSHHMHVQVKTK
jgi:hypothetical protein